MRSLIINDLEYNRIQNYCSNKIRTSQYTWYSFVPKIIWWQLRNRVALWLYIVLFIINLFVDTFAPLLAVFPLIFSFFFGSLSEAIADIRRHRSDTETNNKIFTCLKKSIDKNDILEENNEDEHLCTILSQNMKPGTMILLNHGDIAPADCIVLKVWSEISNDKIYLKTSVLDGEPNLKIKFPTEKTQDFEDFEQFEQLNSNLTFKEPSIILCDFEMVMDDDIYDNKVFIPSGAEINMGKILAFVIYAGHDSKLLLNFSKPKPKRAFSDIFINRLSIILIIISILVVIFVSMWGWKINGYDLNDVWYLAWNTYDFGDYFEGLLRNCVIFGYLLPISLFVELDVIRFINSFYVEWDGDLSYYGPSFIQKTFETLEPSSNSNSIVPLTIGSESFIQNADNRVEGHIFNYGTQQSQRQNFWIRDRLIQHSQPKIYTYTPPSYNGNESLRTLFPRQVHAKIRNYAPASNIGLVNTFFFDKTGTLTENSMTLELLYVNHCYLFNHLLVKAFTNGYDTFFPLTSQCYENICHNFDVKSASSFHLLIIAMLVNSSIFPVNETDEFVSESTDELAFANFLKKFDIVIHGRNNIVCLEINKKVFEVEILATQAFLSERSRMAVLCKLSSDCTVLFLKGSELEVGKRLKSDSNLFKVSEVISKKGFRSLCFAYKKMDETFDTTQFLEDLNNAGKNLSNRIADEDVVWDKITQNMEFLGVTGVSDEIAPQIGFLLNHLQLSRCETWILTGDRGDTVVSLLQQLNVITEDVPFIHFSSFESHDDASEKLIDLLARLHIHQYQLERPRNKEDSLSVLFHDRDCSGKQVVLGLGKEVWHLILQESAHFLFTSSCVSNRGLGNPVEDVDETIGEASTITEIKEDLIYYVYLLSEFAKISVCYRLGPRDKALIVANYKHVSGHRKYYQRRYYPVIMERIIFYLENLDVEPSITLSRSELKVPDLYYSLPLCKPRYWRWRRKDDFCTDHNGLLANNEHSPKSRPMLCACGDGVNDTGMFEEADLSIGICGKEGIQAARSADVSLPHLGFLHVLLNFHGHNNEERISTFVFFSLYKNIVMVIPQFIFSFYSGADGELLYPAYLLAFFNVLFTTLPITMYSLHQISIPKPICLTQPFASWLFIETNCRTFWAFKRLLAWLIIGVIEGILIWYSLFYFFGGGAQIHYLNSGHDVFGFTAFMLVVIIVNIRIIISFNEYNIVAVILMVFGFVIFVLALALLSIQVVFEPDYHGNLWYLISKPSFWIFLITVVLLAIGIDSAHITWIYHRLPRRRHFFHHIREAEYYKRIPIL
eukprot:TRINITY_DN1625_c0_g1_i1.p1 TRINITY_DN1625_c0_g1~~TRINITY_DN1625_c0_g1_i1.p1  ORF type:complete len:1291 (+),score=293.52 TRINITY_DN1625_c0_g1_i1:261-4133(+)